MSLMLTMPPSPSSHHPTRGRDLALSGCAMSWSRLKPLPVTALALAALLAGPFVPAGAQQTGSTPPGNAPVNSPDASFEDQVSVGYVLVPVVVRKGDGGYAKNLKENDFRLLVDGRRVDIDSFEQRAEAPASVVFLQDLSG